MSPLPQRMVARAAGRLWSGVTEATDIATSFVPILCYHSISDQPYAVSPARFAAQMRWLRRHRYRSVGLDEVVAPDPFDRLRVAPTRSTGSGSSRAESRGEQPDGGRRIVITFDDGLADLEHNALPTLVACGLRATIFFPPDLAGCTVWYSPETRGFVPDPQQGAKRLDFMSWEQADRMVAAGMSFQSHGWTHARLSALDYGEVVAELANSRHALEDRFGEPVRFLSYPFGDFDAPVQQAAAALGYAAAVTTVCGLHQCCCDPYALRRVAPNPTDDLCAFAFKLSPAAAWYYRWARAQEST